MVQIFTDTAANLPMKILREYDIRTVPLTYEVDGVEPDRDIEFSGPAFYDAMRHGAEVKTSMVNPQRAARAIEESLRQGKDVLYLGISGGISGSCWGVGAAVQGAGGAVRRGAHRRSWTPGAPPWARGLVVHGNEPSWRREGRSLLGSWRTYATQPLRLDAAVLRGGRPEIPAQGRAHLRRRAAWPARCLQVKPILRGDRGGQDRGVRQGAGQEKGPGGAGGAVRRRPWATGATPVGLAHADAPADALHLQSLLRDRGAAGGDHSHVCYEPVTGAHVGPGTVALFFYSEEWR